MEEMLNDTFHCSITRRTPRTRTVVAKNASVTLEHTATIYNDWYSYERFC